MSSDRLLTKNLCIETVVVEMERIPKTTPTGHVLVVVAAAHARAESNMQDNMVSALF